MSDANPPLLVVQHLTVAFGSVIAIDNLSFSARDRQITAIVGPAGAGKTTVLNCICGLRNPQVGRIELRGAPGAPLLLERMQPWRIAREARIVRTFRKPRVFATLTVLENVLVAQHALRSRVATLSALFVRVSSRRTSDVARHWLDRMGLSNIADRPAGALPLGVQRRVEIARALATGPRLVCMDEPVAGLDQWEQEALIRHLQHAKQEMPAMLMTGQDLSIAESGCDHVVALDQGACIASGKAAELGRHPAILRAWLGVPPGGESVPGISVAC